MCFTRLLARSTLAGMQDSDQQPDSSAGARLRCRSCGRAIEGEFYLVAMSACCPKCTGFLHVYQQYCRFTLWPWLRALAAGLIVAVACAVFWAWSAGRTTRQDGIGLFSIFIGVVVSKSVVLAAGRRRGPSILILTIGLSILSILIAKGLMAAWTFWPSVQARGVFAGLSAPLRRIAVFFAGPLIQMRSLDLAWYAIAFFCGWIIGRLPNISISGPHHAKDVRPASSGA